MKKKRHDKDQKKDLLAASPCSSEEEELAAFCAGVQIDEICFEAWQQQHSNLDLCYPLIIRRSQIHDTFRTVIRMTRTIKGTDAQSSRAETREKFEHSLELLPDEIKEQKIRVKGLGDRCGDKVGDLLIMLQILD